MADMQSVKAAVGEDDSAAVALEFCQFFTQHIARDDFGSGQTHDLGGGSGSLAADGFEEFFARNRGGAALHDHEATGDIGDVCGFEGDAPQASARVYAARTVSPAPVTSTA